jgi:hypothetical protein
MAPRGAIQHNIDYSEVKNEPWLVELLERISTPKFKLDKSVITELKKLSTRASERYAANGEPRLPVVRSNKDMIRLMEENAQCLADRDRVTEILVSYTSIKCALDAIWEKAEAQFLENPMFQKLTNAEARKAFIAAVLQPVHSKRTHVREVLGMCEIMQEHLSHTHFAIKQHSEMGAAYLGQRSS